MRSRGLISRSDFLKGSAEGSEPIMEHRTGTPVEKWDEVNGNVSAQSQDMVPANDFSQLQNQQSEIWGAVKEILVRLSNIN